MIPVGMGAVIGCANSVASGLPIFWGLLLSSGRGILALSGIALPPLGPAVFLSPAINVSSFEVFRILYPWVIPNIHA